MSNRLLPKYLPDSTKKAIAELEEMIPASYAYIKITPGMVVDQTERDNIMFDAGRRWVVDMLKNASKNQPEDDDG